MKTTTTTESPSLELANVKDRTRGLGGTDAAAILGVHPFKSAVDVYRETLGLDTGDDAGPLAELGNLLEPVVAQKYADTTGRKVFRVNRTLRHKVYPFMIGHIDRRVKNVDGVKRILEVKTAWPRTSEAWERWGETGSDEVPTQYQCQVMHYLAVTGADVCDLAALIGGDFRLYHIARDEELIEHICATEARFWREHIETQIPPPPTCPEDVAALYPENNGATAELSPEALEAAIHYRRLSEQIKEAEAERKRIKAILTEAIGENDGLAVDGKKPVVTWKAQSRTGLDTKRLTEDHPELVAEYAKESRFRVLRTTKALDSM